MSGKLSQVKRAKGAWQREQAGGGQSLNGNLAAAVAAILLTRLIPCMKRRSRNGERMPRSPPPRGGRWAVDPPPSGKYPTPSPLNCPLCHPPPLPPAFAGRHSCLANLWLGFSRHVTEIQIQLKPKPKRELKLLWHAPSPYPSGASASSLHIKTKTENQKKTNGKEMEGILGKAEFINKNATNPLGLLFAYQEKCCEKVCVFPFRVLGMHF